MKDFLRQKSRVNSGKIVRSVLVSLLTVAGLILQSSSPAYGKGSVTLSSGVANSHTGKVAHASAPALAWSSPTQIDTALPLATTTPYVPFSYDITPTVGSAQTVSSPCWPSNTSAPTCSARDSIACPTTTLCIAADGQNIIATYEATGRASSWFVVYSAVGTNQPVDNGPAFPGNTITSLACNSSSTTNPVLCVASDSGGNIFIDESAVNGSWVINPTGPWTEETTSVTNGYYLSGTACTSASPCRVPVDSSAIYSGTVANNGAGQPTYSETCSASNPCWIPNPLTQITCPSISTCYGVDEDGYVVYSSSLDNNGFNSTTFPTWTLVTSNPTVTSLPPGDTGSFLGTACSTTTPCDVPVDHATITSGTQFGQSCSTTAVCWLSTAIDAISCPSAAVPPAAVCVATDSLGNILPSPTPQSPPTWSIVPVDNPTFVPVPIDSIQCPSSSVCIATDVDGNILTSSTSPPSLPGDWTITSQDSGNILESASCPSSTLCVVSDNKGNILYGTSSFVVSTQQLPATTVGDSYSFVLSAMNGTAPDTWQITSGALPPGLALSSTGQITGVPTVAGTYLVSVQATDSSTPTPLSTPVQSLAITVNPSGSYPLSITSQVLPNDSLDQTYTTDLTANGGQAPYQWALVSGQLPPGLTLNSTGQITGSPTATGTFKFSVEVSDSSSPVQSLTQTLSITVSTVLSWSGLVGADGPANNSIEDISCQLLSTSGYTCDFIDSQNRVGFSSNPLGTSSAWELASNALTDISCPSSEVCLAVDSAGNLMSTISPLVPSSWSTPVSAYSTPQIRNYINSISCDPSGATCTLADANHEVVHLTPGGTPPPWKTPFVGSATSVGSSSLNGISCPTSTFCDAVDSFGHVYTITFPSGGYSASSQVVSIDKTNPLESISCPSLNLCVATDQFGNILSSSDPQQGSNAVWTLAANVDANRSISDISCPSDNFCAAIDSAGNILVSSAPATGGSSWSIISGVDTTWFTSISCPISTYCVAVDGQGNSYVSTNPTGGKSAWTQGTVSAGLDLNAISCPTTALCVAVDSNGDVLVGSSSSVTINLPLCDNGILPSTIVEGTLYPSPATCSPPPNTPVSELNVTGGLAPYTWTISGGSLPPGICLYLPSTPVGTTCPASVSTVTPIITGTPTSVGDYSFTVKVSDSSSPPQAATASFSITSLPASNGFTWRSSGIDGTTPLDSIACASSASCISGDATGNILESTTPSTGPWSSVAVDAGKSIFALGCAPATQSTTLCAAGDSSGNLLTSINPNSTSPSAWEFAGPPSGQPAGTPFDNGNEITAITCPSTSLCVAGDNKGNILTSVDPATPPPTVPTWTSFNGEGGQSSQINAISCPSTNLCAAVDDSGDVMISTNPSGGSGAWSLTHIDPFSGTELYRGTATPFLASTPFLTVDSFTSISCTSLTFCVATDTTGHVATSIHPTAGASSWTMSDIDGSNAINSVDCTSQNFCMAIDNQGNYLYYPGPAGGTNGWSVASTTGDPAATPSLPPPPPVVTAPTGFDYHLNSLNCPTSYLCLATDQSGNVVVASANVPLSILTTSLPADTQGTSYSQSLSAIGGTAPYSWKIISGTLPSGLTLSSSGTISGAPSSSGTFTFVIEVSDASTPSQSSIEQLNIVVSSSPIIVTTTSLPNAALDTAYSAVLSASGGTLPYSWSLGGGFLPTGLSLSPSGSIFGVPTISGSFSFTVIVSDSSSPSQSQSAALSLTISATPSRSSTQGFWLAGYSATTPYVYSYGSAPSITSSANATLVGGQTIVGIAAMSNQQGYWLATSGGGVFSYGGALFYGSMEGAPLTKPVVGIASTPDGLGYWLVAADGGIFSYGDAQFYGSTGALRLNQPIVGMAATPDGHGYWLVAADGGIFSYGDAQFYGSTGNINLAKPVSGMVSTPDGRGYWLVAQDGGVFPYGDAQFYGSGAGKSIASPVVGILATPDGLGYWIVSSTGAIFAFGDATFIASRGVSPATITGIAS